MKILVKNNATGEQREFMFPDGLPKKDIAIIKDYLSKGGLAKRDFNITSRQANKAYTPKDEDITLVAAGLGQTEDWVKENLYFVKMVASDTTVDYQWDKFSESVIRALGIQYSEKWQDGEVGGRTQCVMHDRQQIVGRTYGYEVIDAIDKDGNDIMDENNTVVKQLIVYAYVTNTAMYRGEPIVNFLKDGRLSKVSISAWVSNWEYISSDKSNWIPKGETEPSGYFYYPDGNAVDAIELSFCDMGANPNAGITKTKAAEVIVENEVEQAVEVENKEEKKDLAQEENQDLVTQEVNKGGEDIQLNINIADYNSMKSFWDLIPESLRKSAIKWVEVTLKNHGDGKPFYAPDFCATKFNNMDRTLGLNKTRIEELQNKVSELEAKVSEYSEKAITFELDSKENDANIKQKDAAIAELTASLSAVKSQLDVEHELYLDKYVALTAQLDGVTNDSDAVDAIRALGKDMTVLKLRTKVAELSILLANKKVNSTLNPDMSVKSKKTF